MILGFVAYGLSIFTSYGKNVTDETSAIAEEHSAILAVNGDYYGARNTGYVIRNGIVYRDEPSDADLLCIYADGNMKITDQSSVSASQLAEDGVWQAFSFGPALLNFKSPADSLSCLRSAAMLPRNMAHWDGVNGSFF